VTIHDDRGVNDNAATEWTKLKDGTENNIRKKKNILGNTCKEPEETSSAESHAEIRNNHLQKSGIITCRNPEENYSCTEPKGTHAWIGLEDTSRTEETCEMTGKFRDIFLKKKFSRNFLIIRSRT
jgi:hypothetical protein